MGSERGGAGFGAVAPEVREGHSAIVAVYDPESKKLVVRVVYDGPGMAGKTTNLQQICNTFAPQRRSELYSGPTAAARTLCLDYMHIDGGLVRGHDLRCHLLTVPGQAVLNRRRQMILQMADTVVFVMDSTEEGVREALPMWRSLLACTGGPEAGVPVVLQANKQDREGALSVPALRERWQLPSSIAVIAANAAAGHGVRETVVLAIRAAAVLLQDELTTSGIAELEGTYETGQELEQKILAAEGTGVAALRFPAREGSARKKKSERARPPEESSVRISSVEPPAPSELPPGTPPWTGTISLPTQDATAGLVWPALEGRKTLRRVPFGEATRHHVKRSTEAKARAKKGEVIIYEAGIWCLKTTKSRRFATSEQARNELVRLAHQKLNLGTLCVPRTVLVAHRGADDAYWLWTISLWLTSLASQLDYAVKNQDEGTLSDVLSQYARLVVRGLRMCLDSNVILDLHPSNFGLLCDEAFYLDDELTTGGHVPLAGHAILRRFDEYATYPGALRVYLEVLIHELGLSLRVGEPEQLNLAHSIETAIVSTDAGKRAKEQLVNALAVPLTASR